MNKTLLFRLAVFCLCIAAIPNLTKAQFSGGDGSEKNPYIITTAEQLAQLATYVNEDDTDEPVWADKHYKLGNDIDLSEYGENWNDGKGWIPIGMYHNTYSLENKPFKGVVDGNNKRITGLYIFGYYIFEGYFYEVNYYLGLFGYINSSGIVKNIGVDNAITCNSFISGIIVGQNEGSLINCNSTDCIMNSRSFQQNVAKVGAGVVGFNAGSVLNCYVENILIDYTSSDHHTVGGVVGANTGIVSNCYSTGIVSTSSSSMLTAGIAGGITGNNSGIVSNCYSSCLISPTTEDVSAGGVVGNNLGSILNCYSIGDINADGYSAYSGGIVGSCSGGSNVLGCAALNPRVHCYRWCMYKYFGRVCGHFRGDLSNNIAFNNILNPEENTTWDNKGANEIDGEDIFLIDIFADGTLGGRFTEENGWTIQNGKLPGLFGKTVDMPEHLLMSDVDELRIKNYELLVYPNPTSGKLKISGFVSKVDGDVEIYDITGRKVQSFGISNSESKNVENTHETFIDISHFPKGVYFLRIGNQTVKVVKY